MKMRKKSTFFSTIGLAFAVAFLVLPYLQAEAQTEVSTPAQTEEKTETQTETQPAAVPETAPENVPPPAAPAIENDTSKFTSWQVVGPTGGDIRTITIDPKNKNNLYVSTLDGQVYGSSDAGKTWRFLANFNKPQLILDDLRVDIRDSRILYASGHRHKDPGGFFKSSNGGLKWDEAKELKNEAIHSLTQSESNPNILLAGTVTGLFRSMDSGDTWQRVVSPTMPLFIDSLAIDPKDPNIIYAGTTYRPFKTTDGGANWRLINKGLIDDSDVFAIDIDPRNASHIYASACSGIYESFDKGEKWDKAQGIPSTSRRTRAILIHPTLPGTVLAGTTEGFWMTSGKGWSLTTSRALEINSIAVHPDEPNKIYIATNNYGVMISNDGGKNFAQANGNFTSRMMLSIVADSERPNRLYATTNNTAGGGGFVFVSDDSGLTWNTSMRNLVPNQDVPISLLQDKLNPNLIYLGSNSGIFRSVDRGASWTRIVAKPMPKAKITYKKVGKKRVAVKTPPAAPVDPKMISALGERINALAYTADGKNGIYAATETGLYRTYNIDAGWERVWQQTIIPPDPKMPNITERVFVITVSPANPNQLWMGTSRSGLLTSDDAGLTWRTVADIPLNVPISAVEIPPARPDHIYVGTTQTLYLSRDGGQKWSRRGGNLPLGNYASIIVNPSRPDEVFVASAMESNGGIYQSQNGGMSWKKMDTKDWALPTTRIWTMTFDPRNPDRIFAGTHSSGIYRFERSSTAAAGETRPRETAANIK
jgi:photosystem II stability/assembly factor-like uncharacterized protein